MRDDAREDAIRVIREIERRVVDSLGGTKLRGMPNLLPEQKAEAFRGVRICDVQCRNVLPFDGRKVLVLGEKGHLLMACRVEVSAHVVTAAWEYAKDQDIPLEVLQAYQQSVCTALSVHVERVEKTANNYERIQRLAQRLAQRLHDFD